VPEITLLQEILLVCAVLVSIQGHTPFGAKWSSRDITIQDLFSNPGRTSSSSRRESQGKAPHADIAPSN